MTAIQEPNKVADLIRNDAPAADARNALGLGSMATRDAGEFEPAGAASSITAEQLGVYTISQVDTLVSSRQPLAAGLTALAALAGTGFARRTGPDTWTVVALAAGDIPDLSAIYSVVGHTHAGLSTAIAPGTLWGGQGSGVPGAVAIGSGLSLSGGTLAASGGGGGLAVGSAVSGGGANRVLYEDGSQDLAASSGLAYNGTTLSAVGLVATKTAGGPAKVTIDGTAGYGADIINAAGVNDSNGIQISEARFAIKDTGYSSIFEININVANDRTEYNSDKKHIFQVTSGSLTPLNMLGNYYGQTAPLLGLMQFSSTGDRRYVGFIDATWVTSTDATRKGRLTLKVSDYTGTDKEGLFMSSNGTTADVVIPIANVRDAADDIAAAALVPTVPVGCIYRTGSIVKIRVS